MNVSLSPDWDWLDWPITSRSSQEGRSISTLLLQFPTASSGPRVRQALDFSGNAKYTQSGVHGAQFPHHMAVSEHLGGEKGILDRCHAMSMHGQNSILHRHTGAVAAKDAHAGGGRERMAAVVVFRDAHRTCGSRIAGGPTTAHTHKHREHPKPALVLARGAAAEVGECSFDCLMQEDADDADDAVVRRDSGGPEAWAWQRVWVRSAVVTSAGWLPNRAGRGELTRRDASGSRSTQKPAAGTWGLRSRADWGTTGLHGRASGWRPAGDMRPEQRVERLDVQRSTASRAASGVVLVSAGARQVRLSHGLSLRLGGGRRMGQR
ncbi:hypothetical protein K458DRAFT_410316 [Lentithecium fluviatile CBS 122367]|uniref:Uncharacterized protein n=1 Tax=Lentithecium fluviatile CBS 122367 TaxID=1168545 RepID=A0A6G1IEZ9_9PLEO|nr:hypothetical protein K458DRAFT_410316 [Lentithecium fluviatile CBS 122367]